MPKGKPIDQDLKLEIISKIRDEGLSVANICKQYNISPKSVYSWLRDGVSNSSTSLILENNRLKKENEQLYKLLGRATAEMSKSKR